MGPRALRSRPDPRFFPVSARMERLLIEVLVALGVIVVLAQFLLTIPAVHYAMTYVDRLEGVVLGPGGPAVTVVLVRGEPGQAAYLLVNGKQASSFGLGVVRVEVAAGDLLEIDGTALSGDGAFEVAEITGGVVAPAAGLEVETHRGVTSLGRVETTDSGGGG